MNDLPIAPIDRIIRKGGAHRVSEDAARSMADYLAEYGMEIATIAAKLASHAGRKTVVEEDIKLAVKAM